MDLREGPDANFFESIVLIAMMLGIAVSLVSIYGLAFDWAHHGTLPHPAILVGVPLALLSTIGLVVGFAKNRSHRKGIVALTLACSVVLPCVTILCATTWNVVVVMMMIPGILLATLCSVKLTQLRNTTG